MSLYVNGELLARWRKEGKAEMMKQYSRLQKAADGCQSHKDGHPGDYAKSLAAIAGCYLKAAACFDDSSLIADESIAYGQAPNPSDQRPGAEGASNGK